MTENVATVKFILGLPGSGKTSTVVHTISEQLREDPLGDPLLYLVPQQMTYQADYTLASQPEIGGFVRSQAYSFTRLCWKIIQETGGTKREHLTKIGTTMLIRKLVEQEKGALQVFQKTAGGIGFIKQTEEMFTEMRRYNTSPQHVLHALQLKQTEEGEKEPFLFAKLRDLDALFQQYRSILEDKYVDSEDYLRLLIESIPQSDYIKRSHIYIDGFFNFTPMELEVIRNLLRYAKSVTITLPIDADHVEITDEMDLFRMTKRTYMLLKNLIEEVGCTQLETLHLRESHRFQSAPSLAHFTKTFPKKNKTSEDVYKGNPEITIVETESTAAEVENVAQLISNFIRSGNIRYRDVAVVVREPLYVDYIESIFTDYNIAYHIDQKKMMLSHPFIEFIRSALEVINYNWRYDSVFRLLKTGFLYDSNYSQKEWEKELFQFENYCIAYGKQGHQWLSKKDWYYRKYMFDLESNVGKTDTEKETERKINEIRDFVRAPLMKLQEQLKKGKNVRDYCEALFLFLESCNVPKTLETLESEAWEENNTILAREHRQAFNAFIELLDQVVMVSGEEEVTVELFQKLIETGIETLEFATIPPTVDHVTIAFFDHSRFTKVQHLFVLGANEGVLPRVQEKGNLLTENEREFLLEEGLLLAPTSKQLLMDENFYVYYVFSQPQQHLYVSYTRASMDGKAMLPSMYIAQLMEMYPNMLQRFYSSEVSEVAEHRQKRFIGETLPTLGFFVQMMDAFKEGSTISSFWWDVYRELLQDEEYTETVHHVLKGLQYKNEAQILSKNESEEAYTKDIQGSVSRLEKYNQCAFLHFAQYGMELKTRDQFGVEPPDIGQLYHAALKRIGDLVAGSNHQFKDLTDELCEQFAREAIDALAPKIQREVLLSTKRYEYMKHKLLKVLSKTTVVLREQAKKSGFNPVGLEVRFGPNELLSSTPISLKNGGRLQLRGQIDRIDVAQADDQSFLRIIDYKSSAKDLKLDEVYYGLSLQMLTYLDVALTNAPRWLNVETTPAGILYFHIHNPFIDDTDDILSDEQRNEKLLSSYKMNGMVADDPKVIQLMDETLMTEAKSTIIPVSLKKDGTPNANSKIASQQTFDVLRQYVRHVFKEKGTEIVDGVTSINPIKHKGNVPCTYCDFASVCQFDSTLKENEYRVLPTIKKPDDVLSRMKKELENDEQ